MVAVGITLSTAILILLTHGTPHTTRSGDFAPRLITQNQYEHFDMPDFFEMHAVHDRNGIPLISKGTEAHQQFFLKKDAQSTSEHGRPEERNLKADLKLSLDSELQSEVQATLEKIARSAKYIGGSGVIMDIHSGELLAMASYPELTETGETATNSVTNGLFIPGSVMKPFIALGALNEGIIDPEKKILSTGSIQVPINQNGTFATFKDWKPHGYVNMKEAIGVSSNVYFYTIGGGFKDQQGLGIERIERYLHMFGFGSTTGIDFLTEERGTVPSKQWKLDNFNNQAWYIGDTYFASIGQIGYLVTPLQLVRATAALANGGVLVTPTILHTGDASSTKNKLAIPQDYFTIINEGMEYAVIHGTASGLYMDGFSVAAKTGTSEIDSEKKFIHSLILGYFPKDDPRYAFVFVLERGPWGEEVGAVAVAHDVLLWIKNHRPEYYTTQKD